jgi:hypothetical protein
LAVNPKPKSQPLIEKDAVLAQTKHASMITGYRRATAQRHVNIGFLKEVASWK